MISNVTLSEITGKSNHGIPCITHLYPIVRKGDKGNKRSGSLRRLRNQTRWTCSRKKPQVAFHAMERLQLRRCYCNLWESLFRKIILLQFISMIQLEVRDTKRGLERLTSDIPNVSEEATKNLDENGLIRIGAHIRPGDILIGKITPKRWVRSFTWRKLLRAIFGDKAGVLRMSLKAGPSLWWCCNW